MVIFRYLNKEVLLAMIVLTLALLVIIVTGRVSKYLDLAAKGQINPDILFWLIWYRLPEFLQTILPLSLFLGIFLGLGRLYVNNEMTVLMACGMSIKQIILKLCFSIVGVTLVVMIFSFWIVPKSNNQINDLQDDKDSNALQFDQLVSGRFQSQTDNSRVVYMETLSDDKKQLGNVFIAQKKDISKKKTSADASDKDDPLMVIVAKSATQKIQPDNNDRFLILKNGYRYDGRAGQQDFSFMKFASYGIKIVSGDQSNETERSIRSISDLWKSHELKDIAEFQWRLSLPLSVPIMSLVAIALSKVKLRQGRFIKLVPAFCVYLIYMFLLINMRTAIKSGSIPHTIGLWWVHIVFLILALVLFKQEQLMLWWHTPKKIA